ncbi:MAG: tetratricopeptide repeat protein [Nitrospinales bacterium]
MLSNLKYHYNFRTISTNLVLLLFCLMISCSSKEEGVIPDSIPEIDKVEFHASALENDMKAYGADHPKVALRWNDIGVAWYSKRQYDKAIEYFQKALASDLKNYGEDHADVAIDRNNLGASWKAKGDYNKAIEYYQKALASNLKTFGPDHPKVAIRWNNLGLVWQAKGEYEVAIGYLGKALAVMEKTDMDDRTAIIRKNLENAQAKLSQDD